MTMAANHTLSEHSSHFGPGNLVDGKKADRSKNDQDEAQSSRFVYRASDIEVKNSEFVSEPIKSAFSLLLKDD
jgi:hypothetical protein